MEEGATVKKLSRQLCFLSVLLVAAPFSAWAGGPGPGWFHPWEFRNPITIGNSSGSALTNFQVKVTLGSSFEFAKAKTDGSDVRITASDGTTQIPFWIESWNPAGHAASIWVNVPSIPTSSTTVYIYYGNSFASSASNGDATFNFFDDFSYMETVSPAVINTAIGKAISWIQQAQNAVSGGVSYYYDLSAGWYPVGYPEVSGYIIPTLYDTAAASNNPTYAAQLRSMAVQIANWELTVQSSNGSWIYVFDTGQVIDGLTRAYQETGNSSYLTAAQNGANWLLSQQAADGSWSDFGYKHAYNARVCRNLLKLWKVDGNNAYMTAAVNGLNWVLTQQQSNGWFADNGITTESAAPLMHTIGYAMEGLFDSGVILNNSTYIKAAELTANTLLGLQEAGGALTGGNYDSNWNPTNPDQVLTGDAQTALVWLKLFDYSVSQASPNLKYFKAAIKMNQYLLSVQGNSSNTGIEGGLAGSDPIGGPYYTDEIISWAAKFLVDDLRLEAQIVEKVPVSVPALDPNKWSFPAGQDGFSNGGGALLYDGPVLGFGPRAVAMKKGENVAFTNGIVDYNLEANGGYDEFGLMYRGQNPETSNSYVFYSSIYDSQNTWLSYRLLSSTATQLGTGGLFTPGTWYAVEAAIGGTSHAFSINGTQIINTTDATFSSGTLGLMAWGNSVSSVTNFRLRQYSAIEPTAVVDAVQTNAGKNVYSFRSDLNYDHKQQDHFDKHDDY